jgi:hypothetical protein
VSNDGHVIICHDDNNKDVIIVSASTFNGKREPGTGISVREK